MRPNQRAPEAPFTFKESCVYYPIAAMTLFTVLKSLDQLAQVSPEVAFLATTVLALGGDEFILKPIRAISKNIARQIPNSPTEAIAAIGNALAYRGIPIERPQAAPQHNP